MKTMNNSFVVVLSLIMAMVFYSCSKNKSETAILASPDKAEVVSADKQPLKTVLDFLKWHRDNLASINTIKLVNCVAPTEKTGISYSMNFTEVERYLSSLKQSSFISDKYLEGRRIYFKRCESHFKSSMSVEPTEDFTYEMALVSQEYEDNLGQLQNCKAGDITINNDKATIELMLSSGSKMKFDLASTDGKWNIDDIRNIED